LLAPASIGKLRPHSHASPTNENLLLGSMGPVHPSGWHPQVVTSPCSEKHTPVAPTLAALHVLTTG